MFFVVHFYYAVHYGKYFFAVIGVSFVRFVGPM
ncbi:hypothetical protein CF65_00534 [Aggregatibacter actinomycetemcomitans HK1651]|nr:hypothetical protein CF65_00534 [Aggregatibacter actinomycetemcomitans HK1651]